MHFFFSKWISLLFFLIQKRKKKRKKTQKTKQTKDNKNKTQQRKKPINTTGITKTVKKQQQKLKTKTKSKTKAKAFLIYSFMETKYKMNINKLT